MRFFMLFIVAIISLVGPATAMTPEQRLEELRKLNWTAQPGTYSISNGITATLPKGRAIVIGEDARRGYSLSQGNRRNDIELMMVDIEDNTTYLEYHRSGYITGHDWAELNSDLLLDSIKENTRKANAGRKAAGLLTFEVSQWISKPSYDQASGIVYWAYDSIDETGDRFINAVALLLGRNGYVKLTYVPSNAADTDGIFKVKDLYKYQSGFRYADYVTGDKLAGIGVASLVAAHAGGKISKGWIAGLIGVALAFAKKAWVLLFLPFAFVGKLFRRKDRARKDPVAGKDVRVEPHF